VKFLAVGLIFWGFSVPVMALELRGNFEQGGLIRGQTEPGAVVSVGERKVRVSVNGVFIIGFTRDASEREILSIRLPDGTMSEQTLAIKPRVYDIQRVDGLPPRMVTPPESVLARIKRENAKIHAVRMNDRAEPFFEKGWVWPAKGRISGVYGSQRILNGKTRRPHFGVDVAAPVGTKVIAPSDGVVVLAESSLYYTGGTIILDHGHGLTSAFLHMSALAVKTGQRVQQGDLLGAVGATGRATGPHLDWRINWFDRRLDPALLAPPLAESQ
jgi:murein DD-endopeptidase MepM/ murein hydrolase activator NlpD